MAEFPCGEDDRAEALVERVAGAAALGSHVNVVLIDKVQVHGSCAAQAHGVIVTAAVRLA